MVKFNRGFQIPTCKDKIYCSLCLLWSTLQRISWVHKIKYSLYQSWTDILQFAWQTGQGSMLSSECCTGLCWRSLSCCEHRVIRVFSQYVAMTWEILLMRRIIHSWGWIQCFKDLAYEFWSLSCLNKKRIP